MPHELFPCVFALSRRRSRRQPETFRGALPLDCCGLARRACPRSRVKHGRAARRCDPATG